MKKIFIPFIFLITIFFELFFYYSPASAASVVPTSKELKTVKVGVYDNYPKIYKDTDGIIKGFWADIVNYIAAKENWNLEYVFDTWDNDLLKLKNGEIDIMVDVAYSDERKELYDFNNETALISWGIFYTKQGLTLNSFNDLEGKNIAILETGILYNGPLGLKNVLNSFGVNAKITNVIKYDEVFELLDKGKADVGVVNWFYGVANESKYKVDRSNIIFYPSELKFAFTKNSLKNDYLISIIDFDLKSIKDDESSIYHESIKKNFSGFTEKEEVAPKWLNGLLYLIGGLGVLTVLGFLMMRRYEADLKRRINEKITELEKSELKYSKLYQSLHDAVITLSIPNCVITSANESAIKIFEAKEEKDLLMHNIFEFSPITQPDGQISIEKAKALINIAIEKGFNSFEWVQKSLKGNEFFADVILSKTELAGDSIIQVTIRNISKIKEAEKRLADLDLCRNKFINVVSHQVRTPLTAMKWSLESLLDGKTETLLPEQLETIRIILEQEEEAIKRIDDMLETLDIEEGKVSLSKSQFALDSLLRSAIIPFEKICRAKQIELILDINEGAVYQINADSKKIRMAMEHLIDNAIGYTRNNGRVVVSLHRVDNKIKFEVNDNGIGIPLTEQSHVFDRFFRGSNAMLIKPDASGLGLKIAKFYIEQHAGKLSFISQEEVGSTFWFEVPVDTQI